MLIDYHFAEFAKPPPFEKINKRTNVGEYVKEIKCPSVVRCWWTPWKEADSSRIHPSLALKWCSCAYVTALSDMAEIVGYKMCYVNAWTKRYH